MPPIRPPREYTTLGALRGLKFGEQIGFDLFYHRDLKFLKSEATCLRYDLRENIRLSEHLDGSNLVN